MLHSHLLWRLGVFDGGMKTHPKLKHFLFHTDYVESHRHKQVSPLEDTNHRFCDPKKKYLNSSYQKKTVDLHSNLWRWILSFAYLMWLFLCHSEITCPMWGRLFLKPASWSHKGTVGTLITRLWTSSFWLLSNLEDVTIQYAGLEHSLLWSTILGWSSVILVWLSL